MWKLIIYLMIVMPLLICNSFNKRKIKKIFSSIDTNEKIQLNDADLMPILGADDEMPFNNTAFKNKFISLQKSLLTSSLLCGIHTCTVFILCYQLLNILIDQNTWLALIWMAGFAYIIHFVTKVIFMCDLEEVSKTIYLSPGHSVPGRSFFSFNPLYGYKYFAYSEQLDSKFGLFDNTKSNHKKNNDE